MPTLTISSSNPNVQTVTVGTQLSLGNYQAFFGQVENDFTSSYVRNDQTSSMQVAFALDAGNASNANNAGTATYSATASVALKLDGHSHDFTSSFVRNDQTSSMSVSHAETADNATYSDTAGNASTAEYASDSAHASSADIAAAATTADSAYFAQYADDLGGMLLTSLFDGSGGSVKISLSASVDMEGHDLASLFNGSGGNVKQSVSASALVSGPAKISLGDNDVLVSTNEINAPNFSTPYGDLGAIFTGDSTIPNAEHANNADHATTADTAGTCEFASYSDQVGYGGPDYIAIAGLFDGTTGNVLQAQSASISLQSDNATTASHALTANTASVVSSQLSYDWYEHLDGNAIGIFLDSAASLRHVIPRSGKGTDCMFTYHTASTGWTSNDLVAVATANALLTDALYYVVDSGSFVAPNDTSTNPVGGPSCSFNWQSTYGVGNSVYWYKLASNEQLQTSGGIANDGGYGAKAYFIGGYQVTGSTSNSPHVQIEVDVNGACYNQVFYQRNFHYWVSGGGQGTSYLLRAGSAITAKFSQTKLSYKGNKHYAVGIHRVLNNNYVGGFVGDVVVRGEVVGRTGISGGTTNRLLTWSNPV